MRTLLLTLLLPPQTPEAVMLKLKAMMIALLVGGVIECAKLMAVAYKLALR